MGRKKNEKKLIEKAEKLRKDGLFKDSLRLWKKIYKNALKSSDISITLDALIALGDLSRILGNFKNAIVYYEEAFEVAQALKDEICQADALVGIALSKKRRWDSGRNL